MLVCCNTFVKHPTAIWHFCKENKKEQYGIDSWTKKKGSVLESLNPL